MNINECSEEYKSYLRDDPKWQVIRENILFRDGYRCRLCGSTQKLNVHHIRGTHRFHEEDYPEDLCVLCDTHHEMIHRYFKVCDSLKEYYNRKRKEL